MEFLAAVKNRRTIYGLGQDISVSEERIKEIVKEAVLHTPSAFNMQSARVLLLFGEHHHKLWSIVKETLRKIVKPEAFPKTEEKIDTFDAAYGSLLYFDDTQAVAAFQEQFPRYKENFAMWAQHANGMLQHVIWTALEAEGLGVNIQHYNPIIDDEVKATWGVPASWQLIAQMPFGSITAPAGDKEFAPIEERLKIYP